MVVALLISLGTAYAVAPTPLTGAEPVRVRSTTVGGQTEFLRSPAWRAFVAGEGAGWMARADERTRMPHRMWGRLPLVGEGASAVDVERALRSLTARHPELLGAADLPLRAIGKDEANDTWYVDFQGTREGLPIWRSTLTFRVKFGNLVLAGADTYPNTPTRGGFELRPAAAEDAAVKGGLAPGAPHERVSSRPLWLPRVEAGLLVLRAAYEVRSHTSAPLGDWVSFVDAASGEVLATYNDVRFFTGTLSATHDDRFPGNGTAFSVVKGGAVTNGTTTVTTDANGGFTVPDAPVYQAHFLSNPVNLTDETGNIGLDFTATDSTPTWSATNGSIAAIDTFVWLTEVREAFNGVVPGEAFTYNSLDGTVNIDDSCNAFYNGTVNFYVAGQGCQNTGRLADVVYHEWGHGFHANRIITGFFDGALSEGAGDVTSFLMTGDSDLAPGFFLNGAFLRTADNTRSFPDDIVGQVHEDGLIFAGSMWDAHENLAAAFGPAYARDTLRVIFSGLLQGGPGLEEALDEALVADDDDGDLSNGTPHSCHLVPAFAEHGLGQVGGAIVDFAANHAAIATHEASRPIAIELSVVGPPGCANDFSAGAASVTWRTNGGVWTDTPLTTAGFDVSGQIPQQPAGTFVEYYVSVSGAGQDLAAPTTGERNPFSFYVGEVIEVHCDDFDNSDGGFTHLLLNGEPGEGADDWQHGAPNGRSGDPITAHSGTQVWGNDLGLDDFNGAYQANKNNRLRGPVVELGHYEQPFLQYWRWLTVEDGQYDQASILANDTVVWSNFTGAGEDHHLDDQWAPHAVDLGEVTGSVQVSFDLVSDGGLELGGWTIDDVCVFVPASANNRLGITDFVAGEGGEGTVELTWTQPLHAPLREVRVVRAVGACPTGPDDGEVVYYDDEPAVGGAIRIEDAVPTTDAYCYAVFPSDGSAYLGWAVEGWNVDWGSARIAATPEQIEEQEDENGVTAYDLDFGDLEPGCGCASGSRFDAAWTALGWMRRR